MSAVLARTAGPGHRAASAAGGGQAGPAARRPTDVLAVSTSMAVLGAALVDLGLVRAVHGAEVVVPLVLGLGAVALGLVGLRGATPAVWRGGAAALGGAVPAWLLLAIGTERALGAADVAALALTALASLGAAGLGRRRGGAPVPAGPSARPRLRALRDLGALLAVSLVVAAVAAAGLAATPAGGSAHMPGMEQMEHMDGMPGM
ncbi:hypothetical protein [Cellulomonas sp. PhB143]|uniref:hypothetical protein n=1 Tax=Cellulomonas sp. PhB143 TaxID=2485186 RepID=UPI000F475689|nr:hypothetical protein [Cellulomonas sp. PhB143]ROS74403.1 hypothetical protein EDF32_2147 [Cellulomonas sp. PhB143]